MSSQLSPTSSPVSFRNRNDRNGGFALIIALSLMGFILLLLLSLTTFVQIETAGSVAAKEQQEPRLNAELGAMIAVGELQRFVGPDQRVTARADVVIPPDNSPFSGTGRWTGVWSSKSNTNDPDDQNDGLDENRVSWLVSGDISEFTSSQNGKITGGTANGDDMITLATREISVSSNDDEVVVPTVEIPATGQGSSGRYGFWVSDDGLKARVNLDRISNFASDSEAPFYDIALAQQADASVSRTSSGSRPFSPNQDISLWKEDDSLVSKVTVFNSLRYLDQTNAGAGVERDFFHDFSTSSASVMTNLRQGGLKMDLSTALLDPQANGLEGPIFEPVAGDSGEGNPGGPTWQQLADFYQHTVRNNDADEIFFKAPADDEFGITPVLTRFQFIVQVFATRWRTLEPPPAELEVPNWALRSMAEDMEYVVGIFPVITFWNPYDRDLVLPDLGMETDMAGVELIRSRPLDANGNPTGPDYPNPPQVHTSDFAIKTILEDGDISLGSDPTSRRKVGFTIQGTTIPAGQAVNYSPPLNSYLDFSDGRDNWLVPGAGDRYLYGFFSAPVRFTTDPGEGDRRDFNEHNSENNSLFPGYGFSKYENTLLRFAFKRHLARHEVNFYTAPFDRQPDREDRFLSIATNGLYSLVRNLPNDGRVIRIWDATRTPASTGIANFSQVISPAGSSVGAAFDESLSPIEIINIETNAQIINGIARYMAFPDVATGSEQIHLLSQFNPRSSFISEQMHVGLQGDDGDAEYVYQLLGREPFSFWNAGGNGKRHTYFIGGVDDSIGYVGMGKDFASGNDQMVLFESPTRTPLGIGQFMHANLMNYGSIGWTHPGGGWAGNLQQPYTTPAYAIGNSMANVHLPLDRTKVLVEPGSPMFQGSSPPSKFPSGSYSGAHYDYSYELNQALWDDYYLSTLIPEGNSPAINFPREEALPNSRLVLFNSNASDSELTDSEEQAANVLLRGGFNVNSTSVAAWEAVLGALRDVETLGAGSSSSDLIHPYARIVEPLLESTGETPTYASRATKDAIVAGFRSLTDDQISDLAASIVREIRTRSAARGHPFLTMADFVNRSTDAADIQNNNRKRFAYMGPLQFAIDQSEVNGVPAVGENWENQRDRSTGLWDNEYITTIENKFGAFLPESMEVIRNRPFMDGAPGALTQADLLSRIGHTLTARSDTFTVRSYGSSVDPTTGNETSDAVLEMVVQRTPQYMSDSDDDPDPATASLNRQFGRKFEIVSTRWLRSNEI
ncbi:MAG: hypothetical protein AAGJ81_02195 [Verrucomicrobiota bacterium]